MAAQPASVIDPDDRLVTAAMAGSFAAFEALVARYERPTYSLAMRMVRHAEDAQEVVQETFLSVVEHLKQFRRQSTFHTWLVRIATNHALRVLRRRKRNRAVPLETDHDEAQPLPHPDFIAQWRDEPSSLAQQSEVRRILEDALSELDEKYRLVFVLRDVEGLSTEETAKALDIGISNVKVRLLRARLMLRERLTRQLGDPHTRLPAHGHEDVTSEPITDQTKEGKP